MARDERLSNGYVWLAYGAFGGDEEQSLTIGEQVREAPRGPELSVEWDGRARNRSNVTNLDWRKPLRG